MSQALTPWRRFVFLLTGSDPISLDLSHGVAAEEVARVKAFGFLLMIILLVHFASMAMIAHDVFQSMSDLMPSYAYIALVVIPCAVFCTLILFSFMRFVLNIGIDATGSFMSRLKTLLSRFPIWMVLLAFAFIAAIPIQVRALSDDIKINTILEHWERLTSKVLATQLVVAKQADPVEQSCIEDLLKPEIFISIESSLVQVERCRAILLNWSQNGHDIEHSMKTLQLIESELYHDGLIKRSQLAFKHAPGASWMIVFIFMLLYTSPVFTIAIAQKRAFDYVSHDIARHRLAIAAGIELYASEAHDEKNRSVALNRYWDVEAQKARMLQSLESELQQAASNLELYKKSKTQDSGLS
jgi:hypothetical protein